MNNGTQRIFRWAGLNAYVLGGPCRSLSGLLVILVGFLSAGTLQAESLTRAQKLDGVGITQNIGDAVPGGLKFVDSTGRPVELEELWDGRPVLLNLIYFECPKLCNMAMNGLIRSLRTLQFVAGEEFRVVTVSFDPREGPEMAASAKRTALQRYGREDAAEDWFFLTGEESQVKQLADAVGFRYRYDKERGQYAHAASLIVLTPEGQISRYLLGVEYASRDLKLAIIEASDNKLGSISDQIMLLCYQYDPSTGKYGLLIHRVLQLFGSTFALVVGCGIGLMLWRERRSPSRRELTGASENPAS